MQRIIILISFFILSLNVHAQVVSGPMLGPVELRDAKIWLQVASNITSVTLQYREKGTTVWKNKPYKGVLGKEFNPIQVAVGGLNFNTRYEYQFLLNGKTSNAKGEFVTKDLWQWRKPAPDFSFITGSCHYLNERIFDRPGNPYGKDSSIFIPMAKENAAFMLWLGDNWYTREVDFFSEWGLWYRASHERAAPVIQGLLKAMPQIAIWDDHDFGPDNSGSSFHLKETSREVMMNYWCNPSYGQKGEGIYSIVSWGDVDLFMCDDRWWRSNERMKDSVNGRPNAEKRMLGEQQMEWLKNSLLFSRATFKIIVIGSQVLNPVSPYDKLSRFPVEYFELMNFLSDNKINGVLFLSGDRHHSEIIKVDRPGTYSLYDITVSPLTSGTHKFGGAEANNPYRVIGIDEKQNYGRISFVWEGAERKMKVEFLGLKGEKLGEWSINAKDLRTPN